MGNLVNGHLSNCGQGHGYSRVSFFLTGQSSLFQVSQADVSVQHKHIPQTHH